MHAPTISIADQAHTRTRTDALSRAVLAGFAASLAMLLTFLLVYNVARLLSVTPTLEWPVLERPSMIHPAIWVTREHVDVAPGEASSSADPLSLPHRWLINLTHNRLIDASLSDVYLAAGVYLAGGLLWALLYTLVEPRLPGSAWKRGVLFAMLPALVSLVVVLPMLGGGLFGLAFGAGPLPTIGNVLLHAVYGAILGIFYGPFGDRDASTLERSLPVSGDRAGRSYEPVAALSLLGGLFVGGVIGLIATFEMSRTSDLFVGTSAGALVLWGALLGAVIGLFVGSFAGLGRTAPRHPEA
jgi:hypothetical protein